jgi:hypothetical protein
MLEIGERTKKERKKEGREKFLFLHFGHFYTIH